MWVCGVVAGTPRLPPVVYLSLFPGNVEAEKADVPRTKL